MAKTALTRKQKKLTAKPKTPFEKIWAQVEKKQKRNAEQVAMINKWFENFEKKVLPVEQDYLDAKEDLFKHLIVFFKRKSLSQYQRGNLFEWIEDLLLTLESNPFYNRRKLADLHQQLNDAIGIVHQNMYEKEPDKPISHDSIEEVRALIDEILDGQRQYTDEQLAAFVRNPKSFEEELESIYDEMAASEDDDCDGDDFDEEQEYFNPFEEHSPEQSNRRERLKSLFDDAELGKIYKLLANKLHPDKETDLQLKAYKSEQMALLSKAKKAKDAFTLIQMFQTHLPKKAKEFDPNLSDALYQLLNEKLFDLDREFETIDAKMGVAGMVWQRFGAKTNKQIEKNFSEYLEYLNEGQVECGDLLQNMTNLKTLKQVLNLR